MDDHSDGPTRVVYIAIFGLAVAVGLLAYFIVDDRGGRVDRDAMRGVRYDMPVATPNNR
jgi:hypothetical protein